MMLRSGVFVFVSLVLAGPVLLAGCGGESASEATPVASVSPGTAAFLSWDPPETYDDDSPLDPFTELDYYEFYVRGDGNFTDNDLPVAQVAAVTSVLSPDGTVDVPALTTAFDLQNLLPFFLSETTGYLSIRAVSLDGTRSDFSEPIVWTQPEEDPGVQHDHQADQTQPGEAPGVERGHQVSQLS